MQEKEHEMFDRIDALTQDVEAMPHGPYFTCTMDTFHADHCILEIATGERHCLTVADTPTRCRTLSRMELALHHENMCWRLAGMSPAQASYDNMRMNCQIGAILYVLKTSLGIEQSKLDETFQTVLLEEMRNVRETNQPAVEQARREQIAVRKMPPIFGPNGRTVSGQG